MSAHKNPWVPKSLEGRYEPVRQLGGNGRSEAWVLRDVHPRAAFGVGLLLKSWPISEGARARLEQEGMRALTASPISRPLAWGVDDNRVWVLREFVSGSSLAERLEKLGPLPLAEVVALGLALCEPLERLHAANLIHRDLKPSNVILRSGSPWDAVLVDFELSGRLVVHDDDAMRRTGAGEIFGSLRYMSPEQIRGLPQTTASDVFGLGLLLLEAATGEIEVAAEVPALLAVARATSPPDVAIVPRPLRALLARMLAREPTERPPLHEVRGVLLAWHRERSPGTQRSEPPRPGAMTMAMAARGDTEVLPSALPPASVELPQGIEDVRAASRRRDRVLVLGTLIACAAIFAVAVGPTIGGVRWVPLIWLMLPISPAAGIIGYRMWLKRRVPTPLEADLAVLSGKPRSKSELTRSIAIHVEKVVAQLHGLDRAKGETVLVLWQECMELKDPVKRAEAIPKFFDTLGQLHLLVAPWYVRHDKLITAVGAIATSASTIVGIVAALHGLAAGTP